MDILGHLVQGFGQAILPINLLAGILGGILGIIVGGLPGLGSVAGVALLLPLTFKMNPTTAIIMLAAIYYGNMFGGAISAILINIPGDSPAVMTALDGNQLAKQGRAGQALFAAFGASFIGGFIGIIILTVLGPALAFIGLKFGPPEFVALIVLALTSIGWLVGENPIKGVIAGSLGLLLASIGVDAIQGQPRFTFGLVGLSAGVPFIPFVIGLFGVSQVMQLLAFRDETSADTEYKGKLSLRSSLPSIAECVRAIPTAIRSSLLGFYIGLLPGSGATTAAFLSYIAEKKFNKNPERLGKGALEGVVASEAANNAGSIGAFAPLLSLGIPGSATAAILLGGLMMWGLTPGPLLFQEAPEFVWSLISSMYVGNLLVALICIVAIPVLIYVLRVPSSVLAPLIIALSILGSYSVNNRMFDLWVMLFAGIIGYFMNRMEYPIPAMVLSLVLGPRLMTSIRQSFMISYGSPAIFVTRPISLVLLLLAVGLTLLPVLTAKRKKKGETGAKC